MSVSVTFLVLIMIAAAAAFFRSGLVPDAGHRPSYNRMTQDLNKDSDTLERLSQALASNDEQTRARASYLIWHVFGSDAEPIVPQLAKLLHHDDPNVRLSALKTIVLTSPLAANTLPQLKVLEERDPSRAVRVVAKEAIESIQFYSPSLTDEQKRKMMQDPDTVVRMAEVSDPRYRYYAVKILAQLDHSDGRFLLALQSLAKDTKPFVRNAAAEALKDRK